MGDLSLEEIEELITETDKLIETNTICQAYARVEHLERVNSAIRQLLDAQKWREIDDKAKNGDQYLFKCRWPDQSGYAEETIVLRWDRNSTSVTNCWLDWDETAIHNDVPVMYCPLPPLKDQGEQGDE